MKRACIAILFALFAPAALAQGGQNITCTASNITLSFGAFDVLAGTTLDAAGSFTVNCVSSASQDRNVTYTAQLAVTPARQMAPPAGADRLTYEVYVDSSRTQPWGDGTGGTNVHTVDDPYRWLPTVGEQDPDAVRRSFHAFVTERLPEVYDCP